MNRDALVPHLRSCSSRCNRATVAFSELISPCIEWTRAQFRMWAEGLAADRGYAVRFDGVGGGAWDETRRPDNKLHGPGPSSQMAVFTRCDGHETAVLAPPTAKAMAPPPEPRVVWSSAALNMVTAGTAAMLTAAAYADADEDWVYPPGWGGGASVE